MNNAFFVCHLIRRTHTDTHTIIVSCEHEIIDHAVASNDKQESMLVIMNSSCQLDVETVHEEVAYSPVCLIWGFGGANNF